MTGTRIRPALPADREQLLRLRLALWPESSAGEQQRELAQIFSEKPPGRLPVVVFVAEDGDGVVTGFLEVGLRSHADGCDPILPVGFVEGWFVSEGDRRKGVGAQLMAAAEDWARGQGCVEMASDTWVDDDLSQRVHQALGFEVVDRCVNFRKAL